MLRPMANLFAVADRDPKALDALERRFKESGEFDHVWRPQQGWIAASDYLPESEPDSEQVRARGFAFAEGRDRLEQGDGYGWLDRVAELADTGPARLGEFSGDFGFLRVRSDGTAVVVRSCAGLVPFYFHRRADNGLAIGTRLSFFPSFLSERFQADPLINVAIHSCDRFIDGRTSVEGVKIVPHGSHTEIRPGGTPRTTIYWDPQPPVGSLPKPDPEHPRELRALLLSVLERDLDERGRNLITLSGGVDSTALAALAAGTAGRRISSWSLLPAWEPERSQELSYIDPLVSEFGIEPALKSEYSDEWRVRGLDEAAGAPFPVYHPALGELPRIAHEREVRVLFGGDFGDQICGHRVRMSDWARHTTLRDLVLRRQPLPFGPRDYAVWARRRFRDVVRRPVLSVWSELPDWAHPEIQEEYRDWFDRYRAAQAREQRPLKQLAEYVANDAWVPMNWEGTTPLGVRRSLPFFNREVLELAFRCHPHELLGPGPKRLLREALRDDVPPRNLQRPDKGGWGGAHFGPQRQPDPELPAGAERLVRSDWRPPPPDRAPEWGTNQLRVALRVVRYLNDRQPRD